MRFPRKHLVACAATALAACADPAPPPRAAVMPAVPFAEVFPIADTLTPEQPDSAPLGLISGLSFAADGSFVLTDVRAGQVMRYARDGRLLDRMGGHGHGPGEFQMPMYPVMDALGRIHVLDLQQPRITVFNRDGRVLRTVPVGRLGRIADLEVLPGGDYLLAAWGEGSPNLLFHTDSLGRVRAGYVPHAAFRPEGERAAATWGNVRNASLAVAGDEALVVTSLSDSLWTVNLRTGATSSRRITPPAYVAPTAPRESMSAGDNFSRWADSWTTTSLVRASGPNTMVVFVRGILMRGDPAVMAYRGPDGAWRGLTEAPIVLALHGDTVITLLDPNAETLRFGVHVRRRKR